MKITVDIPDEEIAEAVKDMLVKNAVDRLEDELYHDSYARNRYNYREEIKKAIRSLLKEHLDDLSDRAVKAAATSIENRGIKKMMEAVVK